MRRSSSLGRSSTSHFSSASKRSSSIPRPSIGGSGPLRVRNDDNIKNPTSSKKTSMGYGFSGRPSVDYRRSNGGNGDRLSFGQSKTPSKGMRRSSHMGVPLVNGIPKDPRKVSDKNFQAKCVAKLVEFLSEKGYPQQLSPGILKAPPRKDFFQIFEFLYSMLTPRYKIGKKPEEEIPKIFKELGYPFMISKTAMYALGSPHTWPTILSALVWMVDLIKFGMRVGMSIDSFIYPPDEDEFDSMSEAQILFDYVVKTYAAYMKGDDTFEDFDARLSHHLSQKVYGVSGGIENLDEENKRLENELGSLEKENQESREKLKRMQEEAVNLEGNIEEMEKFLSEMDNYLESQEKYIHNLEEEIESLVADLNSIKAKNQEKQLIFESQEFTPEDIERIKINRKDLMRQINDAEARVTSIDQEIWSEEIRASKMLEKVESSCNEYNDLAQRLKLIPQTAQYACGVDYELSSCYSARDKFTEVVKPSLLCLKEQLAEVVYEKSKELILEKDVFEQCVADCMDSENELKLEESQLKRLEEDLEYKKQVHQKEFQKLQEEKESLEKELSVMKLSSNKTIAEGQKELRDTQKSVESKIRSMEHDGELYETFLKKASSKMITHKERVEGVLENGVQKLEMIKKDCLKK
ncbi:kinetochore protein NDC80 homolog [Ostrea edulis]|uniref:kinetochore protein NDC80 homolog n=1 Tax=Ostrea edulis TaxID=37623 RepID=UPI0024AF96EA|nr:kinetochore protein NDC80 homolog [Ostrea edulis]XP_048727601.2 kinetochore protein NDC80 homolog [Ostrea edulis]XP_048727602.2 kinetochore protein NDC80 homolog [Ostrea edulis]XP_055997716.1 kinetochore protein NDC80 homolog [Ostrea edulis]XP_055997717.1 kinetochore protein NDC80 homolog [Ostrea edulis]